MKKLLFILCFVSFNLLAFDNVEEEIAKIQKTKQEIFVINEKLEKEISQRRDLFERVNSELINAQNLIDEKKITYETYLKIVQRWRELANLSFDFFSNKSNFSFNYNKDYVPSFETEEEAASYISEKKIVDNLYEKFQKNRENFIKLSRDQQSVLLLSLGKIRSDLIQMDVKISKNKEYFSDLLIELRLIQYRPLMFLYSKTIEYKEIIKQGFSGVAEIFSQILLLTFVVGILLTAKRVLKYMSSLLLELQKKIVDASIYGSKKSFLVLSLSWSSPYFQWVGILLIFVFARSIIDESRFYELGAVFPYFIYFFIYKIFRIFSSAYLNKVIYFSRSESFSSKIDYVKKIKIFSRNFGLYFLISAWLLHLSQSIVRKALVYDLIYDLFSATFVILAFFEAQKWSCEIYGKKNKFSYILSLPILIFKVIKIPVLKFLNFLKNKDFIKSVLVQFYRKKLESAAKTNKEEVSDSREIPTEYLELFKKEREFIAEEFFKIKTHPYDEILGVLDCWHRSKIKENSLIIYGESGIGKSYLLSWMQDELCKFKDLEILNLKISDKIVKKNELQDLLCGILNISEEENLEEKIKNWPTKTVVIIDDCHNLFLAKKYGFRAFKYFIDLISVSNSNIFFLVSFNRYSWNYLQNALSVSQYFCYQFRLPRWNDYDIKKLILSKHKKTGFSLTYDSLIFALGDGNSRKDFEDIEQKFFEMIWSQSRGNPRTASSIWLSSLRKIGEDKLKITLPKITKFSNLINLSDDQFFIYAAIAKHQKLSLQEILDITEMPRGAIMSCIRYGLDNGYLNEIKEGGRFRLSGSWQIMISKVLINKNFIYE
jgi:hypothetical protein